MFSARARKTAREARALPISTSVFGWKVALALFLFFAGSALADVHYVDVNSTNATPPYTNWTSAATNIQDAVDAAVAGDEIVVTNGIYATGGRATIDQSTTTNRVVVDKPLALRSVNGPQSTIIDGGGFFRCVYLTNGASLSGFTLTNGFARFGGGARGGTLNNCILTGNRTASPLTRYNDASGGGAFGCTLNNCTLARNSVGAYQRSVGGGAVSCTLNNCTLTGNSAYHPGNFPFDPETYGGGAAYCRLNNCTLSDNFLGDNFVGGRAFGGGAYNSTLNNCTLTGNSAWVSGSGAYGSTLNNCIDLDGSDISTLNHCWTTAPLFVDQASGNLRLQSNSPCINSGLDAFAPAGADLDGNPRIAGVTVDIGAYEFQSPASTISYAWLQQFNLPINPATDTADPDSDGVNNYREWLAGSDPTNPFSFPPLLTLIPDGANVILTWRTNAIGFTLQSTTNLGSPAVWTTNSPAPVVIGGQNVVTNPMSSPQQFYRLRQ